MGRVEFGAEEVTRKDGAKAWRPFIQFTEGEHPICFRCDFVAESAEKAAEMVKVAYHILITVDKKNVLSVFDKEEGGH